MSQAVQLGNFNFRFQCQPACTNCCTGAGEVYLADEDVDRIAARLGTTAEEFQQTYCERDDGGELRLTTPSGKACHFLLEEACAIHDYKPVQCRTFPFWPENVAHRRAWKKLSRHCPGVGVGPIVPVEQVRAAAQQCQDAGAPAD